MKPVNLKTKASNLKTKASNSKTKIPIFKKETEKIKKNKAYWKQRFKSVEEKNKKILKIKRRLKYIFLLTKYKNIIEYKNIKLLKAFLTKYAEIKPRKLTQVKMQYQRQIAKSIRKARYFGLLPFTCIVNI